MARIIAIANQKGGVGKTTTTANLAAGLAELGKKVLAVDFDPQGNLSICLGAEIETLEVTINNALFDDKVTIRDIILKTEGELLDLVPANIDLAAAEMALQNEPGRDNVLSSKLKIVKDEYDFILIDCAPSLGVLTINALVASKEVIVPVSSSYLAVKGLAQLVTTVNKVKARLNPALDISGVLLTRYDPRTTHAKEVLELLKKSILKDKVFNTIISQTVRFDEAPVAGKPILSYDSSSKGAQAYRDLSREVLGE